MAVRLRDLVAVVLLLGALLLQGGLAAEGGGDLRDVKGLLSRIPAQFRQYEVILEPDRNEPEWWAGAPSVVRDGSGTFWLACRMRTADSPRGLRG